MLITISEEARKNQIVMQREVAAITNEEMKPIMKEMGFNVPPTRMYEYLQPLQKYNQDRSDAAKAKYEADPDYCPCGNVLPYNHSSDFCSERCKAIYDKRLKKNRKAA